MIETGRTHTAYPLPWTGREESVPIADTGDADVPFVIRDADGEVVLTIYEDYGRTLDEVRHVDLGQRILLACNLFPALVEALAASKRLVTIVDELCGAVDSEGEDIGGHRGSLTILREIGPQVVPLTTQLDAILSQARSAPPAGE